MKQWLCLLFLVLSLMACTPETVEFLLTPPTMTPTAAANPTSTPAPTLPPAQTDALLTSLDQAESQWQEMGLGDYRIVVTTISFWHMQRHEIVIRFGEVSSATATCVPTPIEMGNCEVTEFDPSTFFVPNLFTQARTLAQMDEGRWTTLIFDDTYHFPNRISYNRPDIIDGGSIWQVDEFQPLR